MFKKGGPTMALCPYGRRKSSGWGTMNYYCISPLNPRTENGTCESESGCSWEICDDGDNFRNCDLYLSPKSNTTNTIRTDDNICPYCKEEIPPKAFELGRCSECGRYF